MNNNVFQFETWLEFQTVVSINLMVFGVFFNFGVISLQSDILLPLSTIIYKVVDKIIMYQIPRHYLDIYPTSILLQPSDPCPWKLKKATIVLFHAHTWHVLQYKYLISS